MNTKQSQPSFDQLVSSVVSALSATTKRKKQRKPKKIRLSRNPGTRDPISRTDNQLALTRSQFTATSPLNYFSVKTGSTPGGIRVKGRELVGTTTATSPLVGAFALLNTGSFTAFPINPSSFPRLSAYVPIYEFFKFHKCDIMFQANQPTTATGEILVSVDYDYKDNPPGSSQAMMRNPSSTMANLYSDCSLQVLGSYSRLPKYATSQNTSPDLDQIYQGALYVGIEGVTAASGTALGYIIIQYDVEFFTPQ